MKIKNIKYAAAAMVLALGMTSCEDFLDRPAEDSYNTDNYYATDAACVAGVNYLYNSPWYDFQRGFIKVGEVFAGNMYWGSSPYLSFSVNGTDQDLINMSYSLWSEIAHCSTVYDAIQASSISQATKDQCMGECLTWKAMAYFYLVRSFGDVPIIHNNTQALSSKEYLTAQKVNKADVYEYIVMTLEKAMELLPKTQGANDGRITYYSAEGLLAKVYLTKAGVSGKLNNEDLKKAAELAKDVKDNSGRKLMANYEDIFRGSNNCSEESLIAWRWTIGAHWTCQNSLQSDLAPEGFDENGDVWGGWGGPSYDLMLAFGVDPKDDPSKRLNKDSRRKATIMMAGDQYEYFWRDHTMDEQTKTKGFDYLKFWYDKDYNKSATGQCQGPCGGNNVKHLYGDNADHKAEMGENGARMASKLATHILRLSDVYLVLAEAEVLLGQNTNVDALDAFNKVHQRAVPSDVEKTSLTFDDVWKERRLELAGEGDRWYDFVRRSYYDMDACIQEIKAQKRNAVWNCDVAYKKYFESGVWDPSEISYDEGTPVPNVTSEVFTLPFPSEDVSMNPSLARNAESVHVDVRNEYHY